MKTTRWLSVSRELFLYIFFGILTTAINVGAFALFSRAWDFPLVASVSAAWLLAIIAAFTTNRLWVFASGKPTVPAIAREFMTFLASRLATGAMDVALTAFFVQTLGIDDVIGKTISNIAVIVVNYVMMKKLVFGSKKAGNS